MTSTTTVTVDAETRIEHGTHVDPATGGPHARVEVGVPGHALSIWVSDGDALTRLASELVAAANCLDGLGCGESA